MTPQPGPPYEWDDNKSRWNLQTRGFVFDLIRRFNWSTAITQRSISNQEARWVSTGLIEERLYVAVWTRRGNITRIISLSKANSKAANEYEKTGNRN